jgi:peptide/nickel transport system substrate-binding protein
VTAWIRRRYEPLGVVGRGGQGEVVRAIDHQHDRQVAMKIRRLHSEADREALLGEARVLLALRPHSNLPFVREDFFDGNRYCIVMDWVDGPSLAALLAEHPDGLPVDDAISYLWQVALALDHLHAHDPPVVHQDVKPGNVIRTRDGRIVLVDFGLSRPAGGSARRQGGTPGFAAPELAVGDPATPAADVYGLAATAFALLSGRPPGFELTDWTASNPKKDDRILDALRVGLSFDPARRQGSATQFVRSIARAAGRRIPEPERTVVSRRAAVALLAAGAVTAVLVGVVLTSRGSSSIDRPTAADAVVVFDPNGAPRDRIVRLGAAPAAVATGFGALWVLDGASGRLLRVDPATGTVGAPIELGAGGTAVAAGEGFVWVTNADGRSILRIDPATNAVAPAIPVGNAPSGVAAGDGAIWVANRLDDSVTRLDPTTATEVKIIVDAGPVGIAIGHGSVWVANSTAGTVSRISSSTNAVVDTINVGPDPEAVATSRDAVWVANRGDRTLSRIDPLTGRQTRVGLGFEPRSIAALGDAVWVTDEAHNRIVRINPSTGEIDLVVNLGNPPRDVAMSGDSVFVATGTATASHRGGTLKVITSSTDIASLDPVTAFVNDPDNRIGQAALVLAGDRLVWYRHAGGSAGVTLVPDLAASLPVPTNAGRTYTVLLRPGIQFSNGSPLTPADVKRTFERVYSLPDELARAIPLPLVGRELCRAAACDLSAGIQIDTAIGAVTFQLSEPDPEFPYELGSPEFTIVPASSGPPEPVGQATIAPIGMTGPYMVESVDLATNEVRLTRNPYFKEWSAAARPDGYPDQIVIRGRIDPETQIRMIDRGDADISLGAFSAEQLAGVRTASPARLHDFTLAATRYFFLNTNIAPFNDVRVRKALNLAVDRVKLAASDPDAPGLLTCQVLPPGFPAYRPSCPSASGADETSWRGPDLSAAHALVDASGTRGRKIEVWTSATIDPPQIGAAQYVVDVLTLLGYQATLHAVDGDPSDYKDAVLSPDSQVQIGTLRWGADFLDPHDFFQLFRCDPGAYNPGHFCDPKIEAMINRAQDVQITDQAAASALWADVDQAVAAEFPWLPYANPTGTDLVGDRVGNYQFHVKEGVLLDQLWVK